MKVGLDSCRFLLTFTSNSTIFNKNQNFFKVDSHFFTVATFMKNRNRITSLLKDKIGGLWEQKRNLKFEQCIFQDYVERLCSFFPKVRKTD